MRMIEMKSVTKCFDDRTILDAVNLSLEQGQVGVICGPSGSGKSTLLRTLVAMESIDSGEIQVCGWNVGHPRCDLVKLRTRAGLVFQHGNLFSHLNALRNVILPLVVVKKLSHQQAEERARRLFEQFGMAHRLYATPAQLSGGERQRVAIIRCLAMKPSVMLFDEPTSALDWRLRAEVVDNLRMVAERGITMLIVTHDLDFACALGEKFFMLESGRLREVDINTLACCDPIRKQNLIRLEQTAHPAAISA